MALLTIPPGYSSEAMGAQWQRLVRYVKPTMKNSNLFVLANWIGKPTVMEKLVAEIYRRQGAASGPNIIPDALTLAQAVYTGEYGVDYRGILALSAGVETDVLGGNRGSYTPQQIGDFGYNTLRLNHVFWVRNTWQGDSTQQWSTGILPYLKTDPPVVTACPTRYAACAP
jgi:hypothetical protein